MIKRKILFNYSVLLILFFFFGCGSKEDIKKVDLSKIVELKEVNSEPARIRIGLIPEQDIHKMAARYEPLTEYLSQKLNAKVTLIYLDNYTEVCDKFIHKQLDGAFFGSFSYALTHAKAGIEPLARPEYQGVSTYRGFIVASRDSSIKSAQDMKGKRLALVHQATFAGYLYPLAYFKEQGIKNLHAHFSKITFEGSHDKAIFAILRNEADIAAPKDLVYQTIIKENPELEKRLVIISSSDPVPSNALCVSKELVPELKDKLKDILLNLNNDPQGKSVLESLGANRFVATEDSDYRNLYRTIKALGIDLNTYPYYQRPDMGFDSQRYVQ